MGNMAKTPNQERAEELLARYDAAVQEFNDLVEDDAREKYIQESEAAYNEVANDLVEVTRNLLREMRS
jgi:hypothetical protein